MLTEVRYATEWEQLSFSKRSSGLTQVRRIPLQMTW